ncbi:hypothetical protein [Tichowtungia aerotolerans]|uniref:Uncharacterized protein n=1 Tax=Tichowtungia aerotolerans TaxID=2697043 RepID=A0A6P1MAI1_9BACT|nr:hypothetical protein [Tichowtungia aerotolerans]QHI68135.1 hypothetical protein GT409_01280 [Tichowtungia aerotolerans]
MNKKNMHSGGVLLCRYNPKIQYLAQEFLKELWETERIDLMTAENPLHLFFHKVDQADLESLSGHIETFLQTSASRRLALAAGLRPDILTDEEVRRKIGVAVAHLRDRFPDTEVEGLFVHRDGTVERVI